MFISLKAWDEPFFVFPWVAGSIVCSGISGGETVKILLVDDDPFVGEMLAMVLQSCDYEVETAESGAEALEKFKAGDIGLVISDMHMPGMDGLELIARLKQAETKIPCILLTGDAPSGRADSGVDLYLVKDEDVQEAVVEAVEKLLGGNGR